MRRLGTIPLSVAMLGLAAVMSLPFYYIVVNTFKTQAETSASPFALPTSWDFSNYIEVFATQPVLQSTMNSLTVTVVSTAIQMLIGAMAAFAMIIRNSRRNRVVAILLLLAFLVPFQALLLPVYKMLVATQLVDTLSGLIVVYLTGSVFCYFLILGYMRSVPFEVIEAARLDGASSFRIFRTIVLPLIRPILVTVGLFQVMWVWNDFIIPNVFISSVDNRTLVLLVYNAVSQFTVDWPMFMTVSVIALAPMLIFFILLQRHIVAGLAAGSVKG